MKLSQDRDGSQTEPSYWDTTCLESLDAECAMIEHYRVFAGYRHAVTDASVVAASAAVGGVAPNFSSTGVAELPIELDEGG